MIGDEKAAKAASPAGIDYGAARKRAEACSDFHEREAVLANIGAKNYADAAQLESDLVWLEAIHERALNPPPPPPPETV